MDNSLSIDLKKLKKNLPPPPVPVQPLNIEPKVVEAPAPKPLFQASVPKAMSAAPSRPRRWGMPGPGALRIPPTRYLIVGAVTLLILFGGGYYIYVNFWIRSPFGPTEAPNVQADGPASTGNPSDLTETQIIENVGKLILLPSDDTPTLAKVSDLSALQSQTFFKNAEVGDIVLMYPKSLRAILYDPIQNKIIEVGPITAASSTTATSTSK
jgi:hypothetical protein